MNPLSVPLTRRQFLRRSSVATAALTAPTILPSHLFGQSAPSKQITVGVIGAGNIATGHLDTLLGFADSVRILGICDVDRDRRESAATRVNQSSGRNDCRAYADFRELNRRTDIDAVYICTPDHWHALIGIDAMRHGKDIYIEKPMTLTIAEGRALVTAASRYQRVVQHGTWQPEPVPAGLDWDMWLGPSPWRPYHSHGCHYNFRFIADHASGQITNLGAHCLDIGQWALDMDHSGPVEVEGHGDFPSSGLFTTATEIDVTFRYANGMTMRCFTQHEGGGNNSARFIGERGWLDIGYAKMSASDPNLLREMQTAGKRLALPASQNHYEDFFDAARTRRRTIADAEVAHRTTTVCNLGTIAMTLGRRLRWDPVKEVFTDDDMANRLCRRALRSPWSVT